MRTPLIALLIAALVPACMDGLTGVGDDDDTNTGATCGNGAIETGETCDDSNTATGDGCSATCQTEGTSPRVNVSVDKSAINTELNTSNKLMVTVTGSGGFSGDVTLAGSVVDGSSNPLTAWQVTFDTATVSLPMNGTATAVATVLVPSENKGLVGTVKIDATSSAPAANVTSSVTAVDQITFEIKDDTVNGGCAYPTPTNVETRVTFGTKIRFLNSTTVTTMIHVNGVAAGGAGTGTDATNTFNVPHENVGGAGHAPGTVYEGTLTKNATTTSVGLGWYCHAPGPTRGGIQIRPVDPS
jgi:cysteine-rich repeat protein